MVCSHSWRASSSCLQYGNTKSNRGFARRRPMLILDRQRYWSFFKAYFVCFVALVGLYIVIDLMTNLDEFWKVSDDSWVLAHFIGRYYLVRTSLFFDRLCGVIA